MVSFNTAATVFRAIKSYYELLNAIRAHNGIVQERQDGERNFLDFFGNPGKGLTPIMKTIGMKHGSVKDLVQPWAAARLIYDATPLIRTNKYYLNTYLICQVCIVTAQVVVPTKVSQEEIDAQVVPLGEHLSPQDSEQLAALDDERSLRVIYQLSQGGSTVPVLKSTLKVDEHIRNTLLVLESNGLVTVKRDVDPNFYNLDQQIAQSTRSLLLRLSKHFGLTVQLPHLKSFERP